MVLFFAGRQGAYITNGRLNEHMEEVAMKRLAGVIAVLSTAVAMNAGAISIDAITVAGTNSASGPVTVTANISGLTGSGYCMFNAASADGLYRRYFPGGDITGPVWSDDTWDPYFVGTFAVEVIALDYFNNIPIGFDSASTTVTVTRAVSGTVNGIKVSAAPYDPNGVWDNADLSKVKLNDIGMVEDPTGLDVLGCNLLNANPTITPDMTEEQIEIAYTDTSAYKPSGTPFRFDVSLHARPHGFMGMGEVKRWVWSPYDTNNVEGPGVLVIDITSCSPWRSGYASPLGAHVGFAPLFDPDGTAAMPTGVIMCTSAHYRDVAPTNTGADAQIRVGLNVSGHTGTNSYVKMFISDSLLLNQFGITNANDATNALAGFVQHFNTNGVPVDDVTQVAASFTRIDGGTNVVYDYNSDGVGDSGFETRLEFTFQSSVSAQFGMMTTGEIAVAAMPVAADFDGDSKADAAIFNTNGNWKLKLSSGHYGLVTLAGFLGGEGATAYAADFDGDAKADPGVYYESLALWSVKLSSIGYLLPTVLTDFGGSGWQAVAADFDGDRLADPALYNTNGNWQVKLSTAGYRTIPLTGLLGFAGWTAVGADLDGDGKADPTIYQASSGSWIVLMSRANYALALLDPNFLGGTGYAGMAADFDGDGFADPAVAQASSGNWKIKLSSSNYGLVELPAFLGQ